MKLGAAHQGERVRPHGHATRLTVPGYRLLRRLNAPGREGVGAEVWSAEGPGGFHAALRFYRPAPKADADALAHLERLRSARHPNLLAILGAIPAAGALVVVTERHDGSLWDRHTESISTGGTGLPPNELLDHLAEAARGLDYLNGNPPQPQPHPQAGPGVIHGDVSPQTILLVGGGVKVAPPGLSARPATGQGLGRPADAVAPPLYPDYAAPERLAGWGSRHSDQYSLAVTYGHLRTGRLPFGIDTADAPGPHAPRPRPLDLSALPEPERPVLSKALSPNPDARWPSCRAFVEALRAAGQAAGRPTAVGLWDDSTGSGPAAVRPRPYRVRAASLAVSGLTCAASVAATLWVGSFHHPLAASGREGRLSADALVSLPGQGAPPPPPARLRMQNPTDEPAPPHRPAPTPGPDATAPNPAAAERPSEPRPAPVIAATPTASGRNTFAPQHGLAPYAWSATARLLSVVPRLIGPGRVAAALAADRLTAAEVQGPERSASRLGQPAVLRVEAPSALSIQAGRSASLAFVLDAEGVACPLEVRLEGLPRGLTAASRTADATGQGSPLRIDVQADRAAAVGETVARLIVSTGAARAETLVNVSVRPPALVEARRRGDALLRNQDHERAIAAYTEALEDDPNDSLSLQGRGLAAYGKGDHAAAIADFDAALQLQPEMPTVLNNRGIARLANGDMAGALADFDTAARLDPGYSVVRFNRGRARAQAGDLVAALADYNEAIRLDPGFARAYKARADAHAARESFELALADYNEAVRLAPDDHAALNNRGLLFFSRGDHERALADFGEALRLNPTYAVARYNRGRVFAYLGDADEALSSFEEALRLDPDFTRARQARDRLLARRVGLARAQPAPLAAASARRP
jgi:tetratricopeptide (TPR) repeat protein